MWLKRLARAYIKSWNSWVDALGIAVSHMEVVCSQGCCCLMLLVPAVENGPLPRQARVLRQHPVVHLCEGKCGFLAVRERGFVLLYA